jgi:hypothetical protein
MSDEEAQETIKILLEWIDKQKEQKRKKAANDE